MSEVLQQIKHKVDHGIDPRVAQIRRLQAQIKKLEVDAATEAIECLTILHESLRNIDSAVWDIIDDAMDKLWDLNEDRKSYRDDWTNPWEG